MPPASKGKFSAKWNCRTREAFPEEETLKTETPQMSTGETSGEEGSSRQKGWDTWTQGVGGAWGLQGTKERHHSQKQGKRQEECPGRVGQVVQGLPCKLLSVSRTVDVILGASRRPSSLGSQSQRHSSDVVCAFWETGKRAKRDRGLWGMSYRRRHQRVYKQLWFNETLCLHKSLFLLSREEMRIPVGQAKLMMCRTVEKTVEMDRSKQMRD